jgi:hypothetical protein
MKKLFSVFVVIVFITIIISSCNKDTTVNPGGGTTGQVTQSFTSNPTLNKVISNTGPVFDTISASITDNILSNNVSDVKITLGDVSNVEVDKIKFSIIHSGTEVFVINTLTKTGVGNFTNTVLWDSAGTLIDQGQSPYTGMYKPQNPLSLFNNTDPAGQWIIKITYSGSVKSGVIKSWGITITYKPTAQIPTFNSAYYPTINDNWKYKKADTNSFSMGTTGENVTWDFSNLIINNQMEFTDEYIDPNSSPLKWHFPQSNLAKRNFYENGNFLTFIKADLSLSFLGEADSNSSGLKLRELVTPFSYIWSPFTFNSMKVDSGLVHGISPGKTVSGKYIDTVKGDSWGKIILPGGIIYNNVLRIRTLYAGLDTINGSELEFIYDERINWQVLGYKFPVIQYHLNMSYSIAYGSFWNKEINYTTQNVQVIKK